MALVTNTTKTLLDMKEAVQFLIREEIDGVNDVASGGVFTSAEATRAINAGLHAVYDVVHNEPEVIWTNTIVNEREYYIPEARVHNGRAIVDRVIIEKSSGEVTELYPIEWDYDDTDTDAAIPESYYVNGRYIGLEPKPDAEYKITVIYRKDYTALSDDTDESNLNDIEIDAALYYAAYLLKTIDEEFESANAFKSQFEEILGRASTLHAGVYKDGYLYGGAQ